MNTETEEWKYTYNLHLNSIARKEHQDDGSKCFKET